MTTRTRLIILSYLCLYYARTASAQTPGHTPGHTPGQTPTRPVGQDPENLAQGCRENWLRIGNAYVTGGTLVLFVSTTQACLAFCSANTACVGVQLTSNVDPIQCYIFKDASVFNSAVAVINFTQYILQKRCDPASLTCSDTWIFYNSRRLPGGTQLTTVSTSADCLTACLMNLACVDYDVRITTFECYLHTNAADLSLTPIFTDEYQQYVLISRCGSIVNPGNTTTGNNSSSTVCFTAIAQSNSVGAQQISSIANVNDCETYCANLPACVAVDLDLSGTQSNGCWVHTNILDLSVLYVAPNVTQYRINRTCASGSTTTSSSIQITTGGDSPLSYICFTAYPQSNSVGGVQTSSITNVIDCEALCVSIPACLAVDLDLSGTQYNGCWVHTLASDLNNLYNAQFVTQYRINRACSISTTTGAAQVTASCAQFTALNSSNSINGILNSQAPTLQQCQAYCVSTPSCVAVDFDTNSASAGCYVHSNQADLVNVYVSPGVTQYRLNRICSSVTTASTSCAQYTSLPGSNSINGVQNLQATTLQQCQDYCVSVPACVAVDFDTSGSSSAGCYIHTNAADLSNVYVAINVTQYRLSRTCSSSSTSTAVCAQFTSIPNSNSINGIKNSQTPTLLQCQNYCISTLSCIAVDFDTNSASAGCYVHSNQADLVNVYVSPGVTQYRLSRICSSATSAGVPSSTNTASTLSTVGQVCTATYIGFPQQNSINGIPYPAYQTLIQCENFCFNIPNCIAIEFDSATVPTTSACWIHTNPMDLLNLYTASPTVTQYRLTRTCTSSGQQPVCVRYTRYQGQNSVNGVAYLQYNTVLLCEGLCQATLLCIAIDFDYSGTLTSGCYLHLNPTDLTAANTYPSSTVDQYILSNTGCSNVTGASTESTSTATPTTTTAGCTYSYVPFVNQNVPGSIPTRDVTINDCEATCARNLACIGIDIDTNAFANYCWITVVNNPLTTFNGVTHYTLTRGFLCPQPSTTVTTTTTTTQPTTTLPQVCYPKKLINANADGGFRIGQMSESACEQYCFNQYPYCVAVDWRTSDHTCFLQTTLSGRQFNTCCNRYEILCSTNGCTDTFVNFTNLVTTTPGTILSSATSVGQCQAACLANPACTAINYGKAARFLPGQNCQILTGSFGTVVTPDYDLYPRESCLTAFSTAAPTTQPTPPPGYCVFDVVFVIDVSGSISENQPPGVDNLALIRQFVSNVTAQINVGTYFDHVGMVVFETTAQILYQLSDPQDVYDFTTVAINGIPFPAGTTNTPNALQLAYQLLYGGGGGRPNAQHVVILVTDGGTTIDFRPQLAAAYSSLANAGTTRIAIGVTDQINVADLNNFASTPSSQYVLTMQSYSSIINNAPLVLNDILVLCGRPTLSTVFVPPATTVSTTTPATTQSSTSTTTLPPGASRVAFSAGRSQGFGNTGSTVGLDTVVTNYNGAFNGNSNQWTALVGGLYFMEVCAGIQSGNTAELRIQGTTPILGVSWESQIQNGVETQCRGGMSQLSGGSTLSLLLDSGVLFSDQYLQTMFSAFSVSDTMTPDAVARALFAVGNSSGIQLSLGPIPLTAIVTPQNGASFNGATATYTCAVTAPHFFSASVGVPAFNDARVQLTNGNIPFELTRNPRVNTGVTTLSRTTIIPCQANQQVTLNLLGGAVAGSAAGTRGANYALNSLTAFPYSPNSVAFPVAWATYKTYISDNFGGPSDPFVYPNVSVNVGGAYDVNSNLVTAPLSGYYYIYISAGAGINHTYTITLRKNNVALFNINHGSSNSPGEDTFGHGVVVLLNKFDVVKATGELGSYFYSGILGYQTSFVGMLIYQTT